RGRETSCVPRVAGLPQEPAAGAAPTRANARARARGFRRSLYVIRARRSAPLPSPLPLTFGAPPERRRRRTRPRRGAAHGCAAFSARASMPARKIPPAPRTRCAAPGAQDGGAFFAPGFFAQAKKGGSRRHGAKAFDLDVGERAAGQDPPYEAAEEQERLAALAPSSALRAPSPASGRRAGRPMSRRREKGGSTRLPRVVEGLWGRGKTSTPRI